MLGELYTIHMANNTEMGQNSISQIPLKSEPGYSPMYAEHIFIVFFTQFVPSRLWALKLINIHINKYTSEIKTKWAKIQLFMFMSKVNMGNLPSTQNTFSVLLDSVCAVTAMIKKCDKSQNATARIPELSQFVTVAFCDGSKCNFSDSCP